MRKICIIFLTVLLFGFASPSQAAWPDGKNITLIVPFAAGGNTDIVARALVPHLEKALQTNIVIRNVSGGAGTLGTAEVAKAAPDGLTIGYLPTGPFILQPLLRKLPYDMSSFTPIGLVSNTPYVFMVADSSPFRSLEDIRQALAKNPDGYAIGSSGPGTLPHLASLAMISALGGKARHIPDRSSAEGMKSLGGGVVQFFSDSISFLRSYSVRALGIFSDTRSPAYPDLPTMKEQGYDLTFSIWGGIFAPRGVSSEVVARLEAALRQAVESPEFQEVAQKNDMTAQYLDAAALQEFCLSQHSEAATLIQKLGLKR